MASTGRGAAQVSIGYQFNCFFNIFSSEMENRFRFSVQFTQSRKKKAEALLDSVRPGSTIWVSCECRNARVTSCKRSRLVTRHFRKTLNGVFDVWSELRRGGGGGGAGIRDTNGERRHVGKKYQCTKLSWLKRRKWRKPLRKGATTIGV